MRARISLLPQMVTITIPPTANGYHSNTNAFKWLPLHVSHVSVIAVPLNIYKYYIRRVLGIMARISLLPKMVTITIPPTANGYHYNSNAFKGLSSDKLYVSVITLPFNL